MISPIILTRSSRPGGVHVETPSHVRIPGRGARPGRFRQPAVRPVGQSTPGRRAIRRPALPIDRTGAARRAASRTSRSYEANPAIFYVGTAHGGVWKTTNNGATFTPQFQDDGLMSVGDVAVSQKNPNLVWVGTGESNNRQSTSWGDGVYKSTDGGKTWKLMGLAHSQAHQPHRHRSRRQQHRARRGDRVALGAGRRSRRLQDDRRRRDVEAGAEGRRRHRRERSRDGGDRSPHALRVDVSAAALAVLHERRRTGQRHLEVDRRRRHVDEARRTVCRPATSAASGSTSIAQREHRLCRSAG